MNFPKIALILLTVFSLTAISRAQQDARHPGIILYEQGKYKEAVESLKNAVSKDPNKTNALLWSYLGLSQTEKGEGKNAVKSLEKATALEPSNLSFRVNLSYAYLRNRQVNKSQAEAKKVIEADPKRSTAYYLLGLGYLNERKFDDAESVSERLLAIDPTFPEGHILKSDAVIGRLGVLLEKGDDDLNVSNELQKAFEILKKGEEASRNHPNHDRIVKLLEPLQAFVDYYKNRKPYVPGQPVLPPEEGVTPLKITSKPRASYTDSARMNGVQGTITIAVLFGASGRVEMVLVVKGLDPSLDRNAIAAAKQIRFEPQTKDGKPVSVVKIVQYSFSIY